MSGPNLISSEDELQRQLLQRMADVVPLPEEPDFISSKETLHRFLKARDYNLDASEKMLRSAVEWRRSYKPLSVDCHWCHENPGYHSIRQVGFDKQNRPVIYATFVQATAVPSVEDTVAHCTFLIEHAKRSMQPGVGTWTFVMDCRGMSIQACNPKIGYGTTQIFSNFYPERLGLVICVHHNPIFQGVWNAFKVFLHENTVAKMHLIRSKSKIVDELNKNFDYELSTWIQEEMKANKGKPLPIGQRLFWRPPDKPGQHDPRGCASYVRKYVDPINPQSFAKYNPDTHLPHPNIIDYQLGNIAENGSLLEAPHFIPSGSSAGDRSPASRDSDDEDVPMNGTLCLEMDELLTDEKYQVPKDAVPLK